jgi:hypothetical protein
VAAAYVRGLIDRDVAAQMMGVLVENTWQVSQPLVQGAQAERDEWTYGEWKAMQEDAMPRRVAVEARPNDNAHDWRASDGDGIATTC